MATAATLTPTAPPSVVGPKTKRATRPVDQLPQYIIDEARLPQKVSFNPTEHLNIVHPERIYTMRDIGLEGQGISLTAASEPFSLFTPEAIRQMRAELFSDAVLEKCQYSSDFAKNMIRGFGPKLAPFIFDAWNSPEVLGAISKIAGIELIPALEYDVGHINISIDDVNTEVMVHGGNAHDTPPTPYGDDDTSAFSWHRDSYPFVCVTMLSDCTGMIGGETAMRMANGEVMKVRGPSMGTAVVMQGRYIEHQALKALGGRERISMVTSFRPRSALVRDEIVLTGVRGISNLSDLYNQYTQYRLEVLEERVRAQAKVVRERERASRLFDTVGVKSFVREQMQFLEAMLVAMEEDCE